MILIGEGHLERDIKEKVEKLNLQEKVIFLGARNDINKLIQGMDIFLFPSLYEGLPVTMIEAQAAGLPCIVSRNISSSVKITKKVEFMNLQESSLKWAEKIMEMSKLNRKIDSDDIENSGFDISIEVSKLEKMYCDFLKVIKV